MNKNQKGFSVFEVLIVIIILSLLGCSGWYVVHRNGKTTSSSNQENTVAPTTSTDNLIVYENNDFTLYYPDNISIFAEKNEGGKAPQKNATSLLLSDVTSSKQLQRIGVIERTEFNNLDIEAAVKESQNLNRKLSQEYGETVTFSDVNKESMSGMSAYGYTMSASKPITFTNGFKELPANNPAGLAGYSSFILGGDNGNITNVKIVMIKTKNGNLLQIIGDANEERQAQILQNLIIK